MRIYKSFKRGIFLQIRFSKVYYHIYMDPKDSRKTAYITLNELYECNRVSYDLTKDLKEFERVW